MVAGQFCADCDIFEKSLLQLRYETVLEEEKGVHAWEIKINWSFTDVEDQKEWDEAETKSRQKNITRSDQRTVQVQEICIISFRNDEEKSSASLRHSGACWVFIEQQLEKLVERLMIFEQLLVESYEHFLE